MKTLKSAVLAFVAMAMVSSSALAAVEVAAPRSSLNSPTQSVGQSVGSQFVNPINKKNNRWGVFLISFIDLITLTIASLIIIHNGHNTPNSP